MRPIQSVCNALLTACCSIALVGCGEPGTPPAQAGDSASPVLIRVGEIEITAADLAEEVAVREQARRPIPDKAQLLTEMAERAQLVARARQAGFHDDPEIDRRYENLLIGALRERQLSERLRAITVSEEELRAAYQAELDSYRVPGKVRLAWLRLQASPELGEEARAALRARVEEARALHLESPAPGGRGGAARGFGPLAIEYSDDQPTRYRGGELGWIEAGRTDYRWPEEVITTGVALEEDGAVSEVIELPDAFCLVMRTGYVAPKMKPFEAVSASIRSRLLAEKRSVVEQAFAAETNELVPIERYPDAIAEVTIETNQATTTSTETPPPAVPSS